MNKPRKIFFFALQHMILSIFYYLLLNLFLFFLFSIKQDEVAFQYSNILKAVVTKRVHKCNSSRIFQSQRYHVENYEGFKSTVKWLINHHWSNTGQNRAVRRNQSREDRPPGLNCSPAKAAQGSEQMSTQRNSERSTFCLLLKWMQREECDILCISFVLTTQPHRLSSLCVSLLPIGMSVVFLLSRYRRIYSVNVWIFNTIIMV